MDTGTLKIVKAAAADMPQVREIAFSVWPGTYIPIIGEEQMNYMLRLFYSDSALQQQLESGQVFLLCQEGARTVGFASYTCLNNSTAKLNKLYILPTEQGRKIGTTLLQAVLNSLSGIGVTTLLVNVNIHNLPAIKFYEKSGFTLLKNEDIEIGNGYFMNDHVLQLPLV